MSDLPPVPEPKQNGGNSSAPPLSGVGPGSDPIETGPTDPNTAAVDNAKLYALAFAHKAKKHAFYFGLGAVTFLFIAGCVFFWCVSHWRYGNLGWHSILILLAFFTPATIVTTVLIRAVFPPESTKDDAKKDDFSDMLPSAQVAKLFTELVKQFQK